MKRTVVLKFGGATLATPARIRRAAWRLSAWRDAGWSPTAVVSACGHTTDRILRWLGAVTEGGQEPNRETDRALATGEDLSASLLAASLSARGVPAVSLRGGEAGFRAVGGHGQGRILAVEPHRVLAALAEARIPIVAGFQATTEGGETVTLGRGASDLSAVRLAAALGATECHLVKDVPGVHDRDPHLHADAERLTLLRPAELRRISREGSGIVHDEAAAAAESLGVTLRIYDFRDPVFGDHGTTVGALPEPVRAVGD